MISKNLKKRIFTSLALLISIFLIFKSNMILIYFLLVLGVLSIIEFINLINKISLSRFMIVLTNLFFIFYIFVFCLIFFLFSNIVGLKIILFILLIGCVASDIGGFICGKKFKGPKLTKISPNKTYSGAIGSILLTLIVVSLLFFSLIEYYNYKVILISLSTSIFCQIGDLIFSFLKRKAKTKDTGNILPGHGGVLDRLDGILLGVPFGYLSLILLN